MFDRFRRLLVWPYAIDDSLWYIEHRSLSLNYYEGKKRNLLIYDKIIEKCFI